MTAGLNLRVTVFRTTKLPDDPVGGARSTGIVVHQSLPCSIMENMPTMRDLEQGHEVPVNYTCTVQGMQGTGTVSIFENDEIEVVWPSIHTYYGWFFEVQGQKVPHRRRYQGAHQNFTVRRTRFSRREQW